MGAFGDYLVGHDYLSAEEVEEGAHASALYGGRLGTALLELGMLTPEALDRALARFHGLPEIPREWLAGSTPSARGALELDLVKRHGAFPLSLEKRTLHLGLLDPRSEGLLEDLAFACGFRIAPYALSEFRFCALMQRIYRVAPSARMRLLLDDARRAEVQRNRERTRRAPVEPRSAPPSRIIELTDEATFHAMLSQPGASRLGGAAARHEVLPPPEQVAQDSAAAAALQVAAMGRQVRKEDLFEVPEAPVPAPAASAPRAPAGIPLLEMTLRETLDRAALIDSALRLAGGLVDLAALFVVRDEMAVGHSAVRAGARAEIESIVLPLSTQSMLGTAARGRAQTSGVPSDALDKLLARALRGSEKLELTIYPISIGERLVSLLVVQSGTGALPLTSGAALSALTALLTTGFERVIRHQKRKPAEAPASSPAGSADASDDDAPALASVQRQTAPSGQPTRRAALGQLQLKRVRVPKQD